MFNDLLTNYERVSDHCSNVAVAMIELESDMFETHSYLDGVKEMHSHSFDTYYEEYSKSTHYNSRKADIIRASANSVARALKFKVAPPNTAYGQL